jgi:hypothetical protein
VNSRTTREFWQCFAGLQARTRRAAVEAYRLWRSNPSHPSLHFKCISDRHQAYAVRIGIHWRALDYRERISGDDTITWFWVGSHAEYDRLVASL